MRFARHNTVIFLQHNSGMKKYQGLKSFVTDIKPLGFGKPPALFMPFLAGLSAALYLSYVLFDLAFSGNGQSVSADLPPAAKIQASSAPAPADPMQIADWHLFGLAEATDTASDAAVTETALQMKLLGVFLLSQPAGRAYAIIQEEGGQQKKYRPGDELPGGASLHAVEKNRVVLLHNHRQEYLALKRNSPDSATTTENPPL